MNLRVIYVATIFILASVSQDIYASTIIIGSPSNPNGIPFSMASDFNAGSPASPFEYQQVYSSGIFGSTPFSINAVSFFDFIDNHPIDTENFSVNFYTTSSSIGNLNKGFGANEGTLLSHFGTYTTVGGGVIGSELSLVGNTFQFDPTNGENLLMVIDVNISPLSLMHRSDFRNISPLKKRSRKNHLNSCVFSAWKMQHSNSHPPCPTEKGENWKLPGP